MLKSFVVSVALMAMQMSVMAQQSSPTAIHPPVGTQSKGEAVSLTIVNKHINYRGSTGPYCDEYIICPYRREPRTCR